MAPSTEPEALLSHLHRTDGSATYSQNGYTIIGSVNGPIEVQRRVELPEEALIDVIVRPAAGVGGTYQYYHLLFIVDLLTATGTSERHLEMILQQSLRQVVLIHNFPRTMIQITLQVTSTPENDTSNTKLSQASAVINIHS